MTFPPLCLPRMQARVIFLPPCPRAQGDCASPELSRAVGIKVSLTGTPPGAEGKRRLALERIGEGEDGGCRWDARAMMMKLMKFWHLRL